MMSISTNYMGRRVYEITISIGDKTVTKEFVEPFFNPSKSADRITAIVEELNVQDDIDIDEIVIFSELVEASKRARRKFFMLAYYN